MALERKKCGRCGRELVIGRFRDSRGRICVTCDTCREYKRNHIRKEG